MPTQKISYNVSLKVKPEREHEWLQWMQQLHIPDVMATGLFLEARFYKMEPISQEEEEATFLVQYLLRNQSAMDSYVTLHAPRLRALTLQKFGNDVLAFRSQMSLLFEMQAGQEFQHHKRKLA